MKSQKIGVGEAMEQLRHFPVTDLGFSKIDSHRALRQGFPEVVFCLGKSPEQIETIIHRMWEQGSEILATRCPAGVAESLLETYHRGEYYNQSGALVIQRRKKPARGRMILVVSAGTSDIPVAEEAAVTARVMGNRV